MDIYVQKDGQKLGPFPETRIRQGLDAGEFVPADLAWVSGRASWQPISALINLDVNQPPPLLGGDIHVGTSDVMTMSVVNNTAEVATNLLASPSTNEVFLYQDEIDAHPQVLVSNKRLKVNGESFSLAGVTQVSSKQDLKYDRPFPRLWRRVTGIVAFAALASAYWIGPYGFMILLPCLVMAAVEDYQEKQTLRDSERQFLLVQLILKRGSDPTIIEIGSFRPRPTLASLTMEQASAKTREFSRDQERVKAIVEAVGNASASSSPNGVVQGN